MRTTRIALVAFLCVALSGLGVLAAPIPVAGKFIIKVEGAKQGWFKGEGRRMQAGGMEGNKFFYEVKSPRDIATGQASGKRQYTAVTITKPSGAATPQIFQACISNEVLKTVTIQFERTNPNGESYVFYTVKLTNGTVSNFRQYIDDRGELVEDVSFTFQKIEVASSDGKTMAMDDWTR